MNVGFDFCFCFCLRAKSASSSSESMGSSESSPSSLFPAPLMTNSSMRFKFSASSFKRFSRATFLAFSACFSTSFRLNFSFSFFDILDMRSSSSDSVSETSPSCSSCSSFPASPVVSSFFSSFSSFSSSSSSLSSFFFFELFTAFPAFFANPVLQFFLTYVKSSLTNLSLFPIIFLILESLIGLSSKSISRTFFSFNSPHSPGNSSMLFLFNKISVNSVHFPISDGASTISLLFALKVINLDLEPKSKSSNVRNRLLSTTKVTKLFIFFNALKSLI
mmetsp:Transcript_6815/g.21202  ORF Transcript_6815/g.21202 Transcript_6815/m.21202 type:complete len:276 (-) Transcript_6815:984-1811(-)